MTLTATQQANLEHELMVIHAEAQANALDPQYDADSHMRGYFQGKEFAYAYALQLITEHANSTTNNDKEQ